jgi:ATP-dependent Clp endopeptidase proteolytic subunit ClpP
MDIKADVAELSIFDEIGGFGVLVADFKKDFDAVKNAKSIHLMLNTPGGSVTDGMAIYNILAAVRDKLDVEVIGLAASMGSIVALAGRSLAMDEGTYFMIHNPWTISWGDADQLRHDAGVLDKMQAEIVSIYAAHSDKSPEELQAMMNAETWLTAEEAKDAGFADTVNESVKAAALCDISRFRFQHVPFGQTCNSPANQQVDFKTLHTIRDYESFLRDAGATSQEAKALASGGWKALHRDDATSDADDTADIVAGIHSLAQLFS